MFVSSEGKQFNNLRKYLIFSVFSISENENDSCQQKSVIYRERHDYNKFMQR